MEMTFTQSAEARKIKQPENKPRDPELHLRLHIVNINTCVQPSRMRPLLMTPSISLLLPDSELLNFTSPPHDSDIGARNPGLRARLSHGATTQCKQTPSNRVTSNQGQSTPLS